MKKATNKILSLALVVMMLMSTFAMMFAHAGAADVPVTTPKDYATAADGEKLIDVDFNASYFTAIDDTTTVYNNGGVTYTASGAAGGNSSFKSAWRKNLTSDAVVVENGGTTLKIDGAKSAVGTEGQPGYVAPVASEATSTDQRYIGQINTYDLENKTYTYEFEYFRVGIVRSKFYFANGSFIDFGGCDTNMPNLGMELNASGYRLMRQSSAVTTGVVGKPAYVDNADTGERTTRMKVVLEGGEKIENVTLYASNWLTATANKATWVGDVIPVTFTIYNSIVKDDGSVQDIRVTTNLLYQPADIKLVFGIGEFNNPGENQYYGVRDLAVYKGDTAIPFNFNFTKVYNDANWGDQLAIFDTKGIGDEAYNNANGYSWSVNGGIEVDGEGVMVINGTTAGVQGAYTPHPFGKEWNQGYYEMELTVNNAGRLKIGLIDFTDLSRVGFDILPNVTASSAAASMNDTSAYLSASNAATLWTSGANTFGNGIVESSTEALAAYVTTVVYDTFDATDANVDGQPDDPRNVRDFGGNRANVKITYDCENYVVTLYEKCGGQWLATAAIDYSVAVEQNKVSGATLDFYAYDANTNATIKNVRTLKGMTGSHLHSYAVGSSVTTDIYSKFDAEAVTALAADFAAAYGLNQSSFGFTVDGRTAVEDFAAVYNDLDNSTYGPQTVKLAPIVNYNVAATDPVIRGIQVKANAEGTAYDVRFISAIGNIENVAKVGYEISKTVTVGTSVNTTKTTVETTEVYANINANGIRLYAEAFGGSYVVAMGLEDEGVTANATVTYSVTVYTIARNGAKTIVGGASTFDVVNGAYTVD